MMKKYVKGCVALFAFVLTFILFDTEVYARSG